MRFYFSTNGYGSLASIGKGVGGIEIDESEYNALLSEIREKAGLVDALYAGAITIDGVRIGWREEIQRRVDERIAAEGTADQKDISAEEALDIILGGEAI